MPNRDATFDPFFSAGEHNLTPDERAALQKQYGDPSSPARQELDYILHGNGVAGVIADNKSVFNKLASNDYQRLFGETIQEGLKKHIIPLVLLLLTCITLLQINNNFSPGDRADTSLIHKQPDKNYITTIEKPNESSNNKIHYKKKKEMNNINNAPGNYIATLTALNSDLDVIIMSGCCAETPQELKPNPVIFNFSLVDIENTGAHSDSVVARRPVLYLATHGAPVKFKYYWTFGDSSYQLVDLPVIDSTQLYYDYPGTINKVLDTTAWEFIPKSQPSLAKSFEFKVSDKFFIERSNSIQTFMNIKSSLENTPFSEALAETHHFVYRVSHNLKTSLYIKIGDCISLSASGTIALGAFSKVCDPTGVPEQTGALQIPVPSSYTTVPFYKYGALLYRIGDTSDWKACNPSATTIQPEGEGYLEFMINDQNMSDNSGSYQVEVRVFRKE